MYCPCCGFWMLYSYSDGFYDFWECEWCGCECSCEREYDSTAWKDYLRDYVWQFSL